MGLRVVRDDGGPIRFRHAFVRGLVGVVVDRPGLSIGLLALVPMLFGARSKRLGDLAAGTLVVQERVPSRVGAPAEMPPALAGWAAALDLSRVDDALALQTRQFLGRSPQLAAWTREQMGSALVQEVVRRTAAPPPAGVPGWAYLTAVLAERRRRELLRLDAGPAWPPPTAAASPPPAPPASVPPATAQPSGPPPVATPTTPPGPFAPPV
jgi:hypothetical protein